MKPIKTAEWLAGEYRLPAGWVPLALSENGNPVCLAMDGTWREWCPRKPIQPPLPLLTQKKVVTMACEHLGGTKTVAEKLGISHRTMEGFRSGVPLSIKAAYRLALLMR